MSLLMLKTKNLTQQDHTLNFELMLNPTRSGLLLNKQRSLECRRDKTMEMCEVERNFAVKNFEVEKRAVLKKRQQLLKKAASLKYYRYQPEISPEPCEVGSDDSGEKDLEVASMLPPRVRSAPTRGLSNPPMNKFCSGRSEPKQTTPSPWQKRSVFSAGSSFSGGRPKTLEKRVKSAAGSMSDRQPKRSPWQQRSISAAGTGSSFLSSSKTGLPDRQVKTAPGFRPSGSGSSFVRISKTGSTETNIITAPGFRPSGTFVTQMVDYNSSGKHVKSGSGKALSTSTHPSQSSFGKQDKDTEKKIVEFDVSLEKEGEDTEIIHQRVGDFLQRVHEFCIQPSSRLGAASTKSNAWLGEIGTQIAPVQKKQHTSALVAKRYTKMSLEVEKLHQAFDKLCMDQNTDELQKLVKLASKLKANVKCARNVSVVPFMSSMRSGKRFKSATDRRKKQVLLNV